MNRKRGRWPVRLALVGILGGLLSYSWAVDRPSPAYPQGQFGGLVLFALVVVGVASVLSVILKATWGERGR